MPPPSSCFNLLQELSLIPAFHFFREEALLFFSFIPAYPGFKFQMGLGGVKSHIIVLFAFTLASLLLAVRFFKWQRV